MKRNKIFLSFVLFFIFACAFAVEVKYPQHPPKGTLVYYDLKDRFVKIKGVSKKIPEEAFTRPLPRIKVWLEGRTRTGMYFMCVGTYLIEFKTVYTSAWVLFEKSDELMPKWMKIYSYEGKPVDINTCRSVLPCPIKGGHGDY